MNTNQKTQLSSTTSTTNGQDRFVELNQGGALFRIYRNYDFKPFTENKWDKNIIKEYIDIGKELLCNLSENKVVQIRLPYQKIKLEKRDFFDRWTPPVFVENGKTNEFKKNTDPEYKQYVRAKRRHLPTTWDDIRISSNDDRSWKNCTKKKKQWM